MDNIDFGSLFDLEHDLPDELINSTDLGLPNGGDLSQLHTSLGGVGGLGGLGTSGQDAAAKHKQLSELLRSGAPLPTTSAAGGSPGNAAPMGLLGGLNASAGGPGAMGGQQTQHSSPQQAAGMMQQAGMVGGLNRGMMGGAQKGPNGQQMQPGPGGAPQGMMGGQVMNGSPRMGYPNQGMGSNSNLLADTLQQQPMQPQQQGGPQMGHAGMRPQQPGAMNKVSATAWQSITARLEL